MEPIIKVKNVNLEYPIYEQAETNLRSVIASYFSKKYKIGIKKVHALNNINIEIKSGERVGLIGPNGSGKTTFLKMLAGIYSASSGIIDINDKINTLLDVGMGLNDDATGIENIEIMCLLRDIDIKTIKNRKQAIINFSGLNDAIHLPLRAYSSGMKVRLATAIALEFEFNVLLIDEFFGAGDEDFRIKTEKKLKEMIYNSKVVLFASHDENLIHQICNRKVRFEKGQIIEDIKI